jgi:hypothetical protein
MTNLYSLSSNNGNGNGNRDPITTVLTARNIIFTGRDGVLENLHLKLKPSFAPTDVSQYVRSSCVIHGIGGMGKTETVLEYTYRYRSCYSHIFWLHAERDATLLSSFLDIPDKVGLDTAGFDNERKTKATLDWFNSTCESQCPLSNIIY